ncbi:hypothetical protein [Actinomadura hibisca]|uniref:hypothetical protein n=1 Tax=Actinomadura hibisca TaxID=68565 RepID=UPI00082ACDAF|nr:hypothetical protein [Actinomadura hibisca]
MRIRAHRFLAVLTATLLALTALVVPARAEGEVVFSKAGGTVKDKATGETLIGTRAAAPGGVASVTLHLRLRGQTAPYTSVKLKLGSGSATDGSWWTPENVRLQRGRTLLDAEAVTASGEKTVKAEIGSVDYTPVRFLLDTPSAYSEASSTNRPEGPTTVTFDVETALPVARTEARVYRSGGAEPLAVITDVTEYRRFDRGDYDLVMYKTTRPLDLPPGDYEVAVSAWNGAGDQNDTARVPFRRLMKPVFTGLAADRTWADADHPDVEVTGTLVEEGTQRPMAGARIEGRGETATVTDAAGRFRVRSRVYDRKARVYSSSDEENGRIASASGEVRVEYRAQLTLLTAAFSPAPKVVGETVRVTGKLTRRTSSGTWVPFAGETVHLAGPDGKRLASSVTAADGGFSAPVVVTWNPTYQVTYEPTGKDYSRSSAVLPTKGPLPLMYRTKVEGVNAGPEPVAMGGTVTMAGRVTRQIPGGTQPVPQAWVVAQFSADGKKWRNVGNYFVADAKGAFKATARASASGYWRTVYDGDAYHLASQSVSDHVVARYRTGFTGFNASPEPVRKGRALTVSGKLVRQVGNWKPAGKGTAVNVYFKAAGSTKWTLLAVVKTDAKGAFRKAFKAAKDGTWLATYKGSATYLGSSAPGDYVDVR